MGRTKNPAGDDRVRVARIPRRHPRARLITQIESRTSGSTSIGRTENISEGGLLVLTQDTFEPNTEVVVRFNLPNHTVQAEGRVAHTLPNERMGIQFLKISEDDHRQVATYVQGSCA